jgi:hypothetical protein
VCINVTCLHKRMAMCAERQAGSLSKASTTVFGMESKVSTCSFHVTFAPQINPQVGQVCASHLTQLPASRWQALARVEVPMTGT